MSLSVTSAQSQVEATGSASGLEQRTLADTASRGASQPTPAPRALALASALLLILLAVSSTLAVRSYVAYRTSDSRTSNVLAASNVLLIDLLNAETGQRGLFADKQAHLPSALP